jgi:hypothetical protein
MALCAELLQFLRLVSDLPYQDRYEGDDEERRVQVGDEVGFAERVVREDRLCKSQSAQVKCVVSLEERLTLARKLDTVQRKTVRNNSSRPTMRLHLAHCPSFPFHPMKPCSSARSPSIKGGISTTRAIFAGIGGSRLAITLSDIVGFVGVFLHRQSYRRRL